MALLAMNRRLFKAYLFKEQFEHAWTYRTEKEIPRSRRCVPQELFGSAGPASMEEGVGDGEGDATTDRASAIERACSASACASRRAA
ncbi:MAG TPA: hypothetical protein VFK02_13645, partial [Kofleriaceae bacterium]|nr:hypothetical protein [Kofleriaceae bacterium]